MVRENHSPFTEKCKWAIFMKKTIFESILTYIFFYKTQLFRVSYKVKSVPQILYYSFQTLSYFGRRVFLYGINQTALILCTLM